MKSKTRIKEALKILAALGLPIAQQNERSALCLLALGNIAADIPWSEASRPLIGITPIMGFARKHYHKQYAPNTRETVRRQTMHQFVDAGIALYNPDDPSRAVNSPKVVYQFSEEALTVMRAYDSKQWKAALADYLERLPALAGRYARERELVMIPLRLADGTEIQLSPGEHSRLIGDIVREFGPRFAPGAALIYAGDTENKWAYFNQNMLASLGVAVGSHGKMPDVVLLDTKRNWLFLIESVTSHGPVNAKRHAELEKLFSTAKAGRVYVTAFPTRALMARYLADIAWETEVWVAEAPAHMIHFNGDRFMGPR